MNSGSKIKLRFKRKPSGKLNLRVVSIEIGKLENIPQLIKLRQQVAPEAFFV
jgi:hypothetical protein